MNLRSYLAASLLALSIPCLALSQPSSTLIQLGARGATETGGSSNVAHYLVRTGAGGKIDSSLFDVSFSSLMRMPTLRYVDSSIGVDTNTAGAINSPYLTLKYAVSQLTNASAAIVLSPGVHQAGQLTNLAVGVTNLAIVGSPGATWLGTNSSDALVVTSQVMRIGVVGVAVARIDASATAASIDVDLHDGASLAEANVTVSGVLRVGFNDNASAIPATNAVISHVYASKASQELYVPAVPGSWGVASLTTKAALDALGPVVGVMAGTTNMGGDVSGPLTNVSVLAVKGKAVRAPAATNDGFCLYYNHGLGSWELANFYSAAAADARYMPTSGVALIAQYPQAVLLDGSRKVSSLVVSTNGTVLFEGPAGATSTSTWASVSNWNFAYNLLRSRTNTWDSYSTNSPRIYALETNAVTWNAYSTNWARIAALEASTGSVATIGTNWTRIAAMEANTNLWNAGGTNAATWNAYTSQFWKIVYPPAASNSTGAAGQMAIDVDGSNSYLYVYDSLAGKWSRFPGTINWRR